MQCTHYWFIYSTSDFLYVCECALLTNRANGAVFNCSYSLQNDYSYIISLSLIDAKKQCTVEYMQTLYTTPTKRLSRSAINEEVLASDGKIQFLFGKHSEI